MRRLIPSVLVAASLLVACQKADEHPPALDTTCPPENPNCHDLPPLGGGGTKDGGTGGGTSSDGGVAGEGTTLTGNVAALTSEDFQSGVNYGDVATVSADAADGGTATATYQGGSFTLTGVMPTPELWVTVTPAVVGEYLPTLQPLSSEADADVTLYLIPASTIDLIYGLLSFPVAREVGRAHVVLRFVDATTGEPIEGVTVSHVGETVSYDTGGSWSDVQTGTGSLGYAVLVNAPAQSNRTKQKVSFDTGTVSGSLDIAMQSDAITLADIAIAQ